MIESSAHGDDYDGVIFSQLVREIFLLLSKILHIYTYWKIMFHIFFVCFLVLELD